MVDVSIPPVVSALAGLATAGQRLGFKDGEAGVQIAELTGVAIASIAARKGLADDLSAKVQTLFGLPLPSEPKRVAAGDVSIIWSAPGQWLVVFESGGRQRVSDLTAALRGLASTTDQSDSRAIIEISGPRVRDVLAKGVMVDLHPSVFAPGNTAITLVAHVGAQLTCIDAAPVYQLMVPRSFCLSFWDWLISSAEEYGISIGAKGDPKKG
ncbi:MAG: sarcosine oxidase subunit gamma family protein [Hyphomicrobiaceae bacterium]|nr:sarcosine oxidase subunit gamma family protein [Hyphomicrobiaceae bacterium]